jgi:hypothetical protein
MGGPTLLLDQEVQLHIGSSSVHLSINCLSAALQLGFAAGFVSS